MKGGKEIIKKDSIDRIEKDILIGGSHPVGGCRILCDPYGTKVAALHPGSGEVGPIELRWF